MFDRGACGNFRNESRPQMIGMKSVIGEQNYSRLVIDELKQRAQHQVVQAIAAVHDIVKNLE